MKKGIVVSFLTSAFLYACVYITWPSSGLLGSLAFFMLLGLFASIIVFVGLLFTAGVQALVTAGERQAAEERRAAQEADPDAWR